MSGCKKRDKMHVFMHKNSLQNSKCRKWNVIYCAQTRHFSFQEQYSFFKKKKTKQSPPANGERAFAYYGMIISGYNRRWFF